AGAVSNSVSALALTRVSSDFRAWTWFHGNNSTSESGWRTRFARLRAAGITGLLVADGDTARMAAAARAEGLEFHRWIFMLYRSTDQWAKRSHPEWFSVSRNGESSLTRPPYVSAYNWFCPNREGVRDYLNGIVDRVAARPNVDGVHLDYIRFIDVILPRGLWSRYGLVQDREMAQFDFCYCEVCREKFRQLTGVDPMKLADPSVHVAWREFRWASITELVALLSRTVRARGKQMSAAVFATPTLARQLVRQAWDEWPLDAVFPMLYHHFYLENVEWIGRGAREGVQALPPGRPLYAGLFVPRLDPTSLTRALALSRDAGAAGVALFSMPRLTSAHLAALGNHLRG
ncbi:MAG: hypothetical protein ACREOG_10555, partial [Gemmatimonadaceae bacterium]